MSGRYADLDPVRAGVLYSFEHALRDIREWTSGLTDDALWDTHDGIGSTGFHIRHLAGSADRLTTYASGAQLTDEQMRSLREEPEIRQPVNELLSYAESTLAACGETIRKLPGEMSEVREIGRKRITVPLGVLLLHIAEHTQRHVGEMIVTAKLARRLRQ